MELKPIRERSDEAGHELPRDYFLGVALEVLDSRFGHADHSIVTRTSPAAENGLFTQIFA
ncbi:MAG: hypothetical protein M3544_09820 [Pseudomonadota bacterium]|nr:hypothetical protein [Pseudomonadota bacterium]